MLCNLFPQGALPKSWVNHPSHEIFGHVPEMKHRGDTLQGGPIRLVAGNYGNRGYGARHILEKHGNTLVTRGFGVGINGVILYIAGVIKPRTPIFCEFDQIGQNQKVAVVRRSTGTVVLGLMHTQDGSPYYAVLTAFDRRQGSGTIVGITLAP